MATIGSNLGSNAAKANNPVVFMDVSIGGQPVGRLKMELFADTCPKTAENFRQFCTGEHRFVLINSLDGSALFTAMNTVNYYGMHRKLT
jgi:hypothetical protein